MKRVLFSPTGSTPVVHGLLHHALNVSILLRAEWR